MTTTKQHFAFRQQVMKFTVIPLCLFFLVFAIIFFADLPKLSELLLGLGAFFGLAFFLGIRLPQFMRSFTCPDCGAAIPDYMDTKGERGVPITYHCTACDVIWETGLKTVTDM